MKRKSPTREKPLQEVWDQWTDAQRQQFIKEQLAAIDRGECTEPSPEEAARMKRVMRRLRRGRPRTGQGASRINVTLEKGFLKDADQFRKRLGMSRSEFIARGIQMMMEGEAGQRRKAG